MIKIITAQSGELQELQKKKVQDQDSFLTIVAEILQDIKLHGDAAVFAATAKFDHVDIQQNNFQVSAAEIEQAYKEVSADSLESLRLAMANIRDFHQKQKQNSWFKADDSGSIMGQMVLPIERAGIYVPGGTAAYLSSVLMNAIPAQVAGVAEIIMVTPPGKNGKINPYTLVAAAEAGVSAIYKVGGAQAIGALAYGTESVPKVDVITGPGNVFVTLAKKLVYGDVNIDMLAGPSEILIVADSSARADYVAADMLSQAEHDKLASAVLLTTEEKLAFAVQAELEKQLAVLPRKDIAGQAIENYSVIVLVKDLDEAMDLANLWAPEHLELETAEPFSLLGKVKNAGAVFMGSYTTEPVGDYWSGSNHILPTGGTARFYSPVSVDNFIKKTGFTCYSKARLLQDGKHIVRLAQEEGLTAHANAVQIRLDTLK